MLQQSYIRLCYVTLKFKHKNIHNVIKKNNLAIFKKKNSRSLCKSKQKVLSLKQNCQLMQVFMSGPNTGLEFGRRYVSNLSSITNVKKYWTKNSFVLLHV